MNTFKFFGKTLIKSVINFTNELKKKYYRQVWLFGSWNGYHYSDNPKYLFEYLSNSNQKRVLPVWISKDENVVLVLKKNGFNSINYFNRLKKVLIYYSDCVFYSEQVEAIYDGSNKRIKHINLWHGMPIKDLGKIYFKDDYFILSSEMKKKYFETIAIAPKPVFLIMGQPKNDGLFIKRNILKDFRGNRNPTVISYLPTYRGSFLTKSADLRGNELPGLLRDLTNLNSFKIVEEFLKNNNCILILKPHLRNKIAIPDSDWIYLFDEFDDLTGGVDSHELMGATDILITDYSSIVLDFMLLNRPYIFYVDDLNAYKESQNLIYDIEYLSMGYISRDIDGLFSNIREAKNNLTVKSEHLEMLKHQFHQDVNNNSERIYNYFLSDHRKDGEPL